MSKPLRIAVAGPTDVIVLEAIRGPCCRIRSSNFRRCSRRDPSLSSLHRLARDGWVSIVGVVNRFPRAAVRCPVLRRCRIMTR